MILGAGENLKQFKGKIDHILKNSQIFWRWLSEGGRNTGKEGMSVADEIDIQIGVRNANDEGLTQKFWKTNTLRMIRGLWQYEWRHNYDVRFPNMNGVPQIAMNSPKTDVTHSQRHIDTQKWPEIEKYIMISLISNLRYKNLLLAPLQCSYGKLGYIARNRNVRNNTDWT